ncbi:MAG: MerC domain-containing protein [Pirellulales bacterium]|nr:MerC domain-containing protein [Pirellulales bacterium]
MHSFAEAAAAVDLHGVPRWGLLLLVVIAIGVLAVALANSHTRRTMMRLAIGIAFLALIAGAYFASRSGSLESQRRAKTMSRLQQIGNDFMAEAQDPASRKLSQNTTLPMLAATVAETRGEKPKQKQDVVPTWIDEAPQWRVEEYYVVVRSGETSDPAMRKELLDIKMAAEAGRYIDEFVLQDPDAAEAVKIDTAYLRQHCVAAEYESAESAESFVHMKFDRRFDDEVKRRYRAYASTSRVEKLGGVTLGVLGAIAAALAYLRFTKPRPV